MFFKKKKTIGLNLSVDIHSHVLPGIDDGPRQREESLAMLRGLSRLGVKTVWLTSHIKENAFPNTFESISEAFDRFSEEVVREGIDIQLRKGAEYYIGAQFMEQLGSVPLLAMKEKYLLVETSMRQEPFFLYDALFSLRQKGYTPILAHPERYLYYHKNPEAYAKLKHQGCLFQLNLFSLAGYYGSSVKKCALRLAKEGKYDFAGTDIHREKQLEILSNKTILRILKDLPLKNELLD